MYFIIDDLKEYIKVAELNGFNQIRFDRPEIYVRKDNNAKWKSLRKLN